MSKTLTTGQLARAAGGAAGRVTLRTIRFYDEKGLLRAAGGSRRGRRLYDEEALLTLRKVKLLQEAGFPLGAIARALERLNGEPTAGRRRTVAHRELLAGAREELARRREELEAAIGRLDKVLEQWEKCSECPSEDCAGCPKLECWSRFGMPGDVQAREEE